MDVSRRDQAPVEVVEPIFCLGGRRKDIVCAEGVRIVEKIDEALALGFVKEGLTVGKGRIRGRAGKIEVGTKGVCGADQTTDWRRKTGAYLQPKGGGSFSSMVVVGCESVALTTASAARSCGASVSSLSSTERAVVRA